MSISRPALRRAIRPAVHIVLAALALITCQTAFAAITATVRGLVHDPHHLPIAQASVTLQSTTSALHYDTTSADDGTFTFTALPAGQYLLRIQAATFAAQQQTLLVQSGTSPILHFELAADALNQSVTVTASQQQLETTSLRTTTISRQQIAHYPGTDGVNSLAAITDFLPGSTVVHDQLHVRGGHQVTWAIDGVPIPNTNIATNLGPQFNPKDIDYLELQSGGYSADFGDRTYGIFNVAPRTGFERTHEAELIASYGNYNATDDQLSYGDHSDRAAYYISLSGNRTDYGLETPTAANLHNQASGAGAFTSLVWNRTPADQLRATADYRADFYQVPIDPAAPLPDREREQDAFATTSWLHTFSPGRLFTLSPFVHFNRAAYEGSPTDIPTETDNRASTYTGGQAQFTAASNLTPVLTNSLRTGLYGFAQRDRTLFTLAANDGSGNTFTQTVTPAGALIAGFFDDQIGLSHHETRWLTLTAGLRLTRFSGNLTESAATPRIGAALRIPYLGWNARASYSRFYQAPPLDTVSGPLAQYALQQGLTFLPLYGERDEQHEFGLTIPLRNWTLDLATFRTAARNYFDHNAIGNSNLFLPLTIDRARILGYEATLHSPLLFRRLHTQLIYSNQMAQGYGAVTGGLTDFSPPVGGFYLDHDQRNTLALSADATLPLHSFAAVNLNYGSGFLNGDGPSHLPQYATLDLALGKDFGHRFSARASATNLTNTQYQLDLSNTFGGSHFGAPRQLSLQLRYRFPL